MAERRSVPYCQQVVIGTINFFDDQIDSELSSFIGQPSRPRVQSICLGYPTAIVFTSGLL